MKAPLRFAFGWVVYLAITAALTPILKALVDVFQLMPIWLVVVILVASLVAFLATFFLFLRRFWSWCDQPRKATREVPPCS
ncbi:MULTISPECIES: hypothetical protein [Pseudomonas]|uniref:hypothetical protein n=1 Tax=Pseudomonas TaxID=286 RepID=UPI00072FF665|nr:MULTISPECIES: hypothetical protein [Pseudomonas]KSW21548.1 hypothetical protein AOX63_08360 [Pseudomonas sp. ADP]QOF84645.1 hypothetical protein IG194_29690 [Pseudomonas sp. ADPe]QOF84655.1 hypothetical protein IG194_29745 [Pseudomonas sp. ADPe]QOF84664.1 hypothetical protein IG194_29795 [Pseudomonas sp. ADPe]